MNQYSSLFFFLVFRCGWCTVGYNRTGIRYFVFESFVALSRVLQARTKRCYCAHSITMFILCSSMLVTKQQPSRRYDEEAGISVGAAVRVGIVLLFGFSVVGAMSEYNTPPCFPFPIRPGTPGPLWSLNNSDRTVFSHTRNGSGGYRVLRFGDCLM